MFQLTKLEESGGVVDMKIDQIGGVIRITGPRKFVLDAQTNLHNCLKGFERIRQQTEEAETLYQLIQWQFEEVTNEGIELIPYPKLTNLRIENAYKNKQPSMELFDKQNNVTYVVDFLSLEEYEKTNKENSTVVVRKDILKCEWNSFHFQIIWTFHPWKALSCHYGWPYTCTVKT